MKFFLFAFVLLPLSAFAQAPRPTATPFPDLVTLSGKAYRQARVFRVEPDGITYMFAGGMVKIGFADLPEATRKQYGYDPRKAATFEETDGAMQDAAARALAATNAEIARRQREVNIQAATDVANAPKPVGVGTSTALQTGSISGGSYGETGYIWNQISGRVSSGESVVTKTASGTKINGSVLSVSPNEGVILVSSQTNGEIEIVAVGKMRRIDRVADGDKVELSCVADGTYSYTSAAGNAATVHRYKFVSGHVRGLDGKYVD